MEHAKIMRRAQEAEVKMAAPSLWRNARFLCLWGASILTSFAFSIYLMTETWYVINGLDLDSKLGLILMMTTIPRVLLMAIGGVAADRFSRPLIMGISSLLRGALVLALAFLIAGGSGTLAVMFIFAFLFGVLDSFFWPAGGSLMPFLVGKDQLVRANSLLQTTNQLSFLAGPILAGAVIKFGSFQLSFVLAGVMILGSALLVLFLKEKKHTLSADIPQKKGYLQDLKEGILYVKKIRYLLIMMLTSVIVNFFLVGPMNAGMPLFVEGRLGGSILDLSLLESFFAAGMLGGALLTGIINFKKKRAVINLSLIGMMAISNSAFSQADMIFSAAALLAVTGICISMSNILGSSISQAIVEPAMMGRVQSLMGTASMGFIPLSYAGVAALLSFGISISMIILITSVLLLAWILIILAAAKPIRNID
ncbi:MFS transporter [Peribacillus sp. SCS-26]|uniref:MFS transporter n=1 Tax=Paraperibacillus marinus TaxID=3115295 RepID=UPI003906B257